MKFVFVRTKFILFYTTRKKKKKKKRFIYLFGANQKEHTWQMVWKEKKRYRSMKNEPNLWIILVSVTVTPLNPFLLSTGPSSCSIIGSTTHNIRVYNNNNNNNNNNNSYQRRTKYCPEVNCNSSTMESESHLNIEQTFVRFSNGWTIWIPYTMIWVMTNLCYFGPDFKQSSQNWAIMLVFKW